MKVNVKLAKGYNIEKFKGCLAYKKVDVVWLDAQSSMDSFTIDEIRNELSPVLSRSLGFLIVDKPDYIVLGYTIFDVGLIKHHTCIPRDMIISIKEVR